MRKIKKLSEKVKIFFRQKILHFVHFAECNWKDTGKLLYWVTLLLCSFSTGLMSGTFMRPAWAGVLLVSILTFFVLIPFLWLLKKIVRLALRNGITELLSWILLCLLCVSLLEEEYVALAICLSLAAALFLKSLWGIIHNKVRTKAIFITTTLTGLFTAAVAVLLFSDGFEDTYIEKYLELAYADDMTKQDTLTKRDTLTKQEEAEFQTALENGPYTVSTVTYGTTGEEDLASDTVDISGFASNEGIIGFLKEKYQGYSLKETPLAGIIWYPEEIDNCPTLFIIHGNHNWITDSYLGYEYLGTYLASHGYVVVSVDENACNGLSGENDGRAVLLLENMRQVKKYNSQEESPLYQKMDYDNLALAGHSRGGEAITEACLFNELTHYPDNGNHTFYWDFSIKSLIAIAPVCGQYQPSDREVELSDVNYMVIHGANDQDVSTFMGMSQYENITFTGEEDGIKTALYVAGLNHGQFNSLWGKYDSSEPMNRMLNVENFLSQQEQQNIAKIFIRTFLDKTLKNSDSELTELLTDYGKYQSVLPQTLYVQSYDTADALTLCDFEEDVRLETGSLAGVSIWAKNVDSWREEELSFSNGESRENYAVILKWESKEEAQITFSLESEVGNAGSLRFDIMDMQEEFEEEEAELLEAEIILTDTEGNSARVQAGDYAALYPAFPVRLEKLQYMFGGVEYKHQFQTVSVPFTDFVGVDVTKLKKITLQFPQEEGKVAIDNVKLAP